MTDVQQTVSTPAEATLLANGLVKLYQDIMAAKASGASGTALITAAVAASIADLGNAMGGLTNIGSEVSAEPIGVAEAFVIAGINLARDLSNK